MSLRVCSGSLGKSQQVLDSIWPSYLLLAMGSLSGECAIGCGLLLLLLPAFSRSMLCRNKNSSLHKVLTYAYKSYYAIHARPASILLRATCLRFSPLRGDDTALSVAFSTSLSDADRIISTCAGWPWYGLMRPCARYVRRRVF